MSILIMVMSQQNSVLTSNGEPWDLKTSDVQFHNRNLLQTLNQRRLKTQSQPLDICIILGNLCEKAEDYQPVKTSFGTLTRAVCL